MVACCYLSDWSWDSGMVQCVFRRQVRRRTGYVGRGSGQRVEKGGSHSTLLSLAPGCLLSPQDKLHMSPTYLTWPSSYPVPVSWLTSCSVPGFKPCFLQAPSMYLMPGWQLWGTYHSHYTGRYLAALWAKLLMALLQQRCLWLSWAICLWCHI